jgi:hypothetical protein
MSRYQGELTQVAEGPDYTIQYNFASDEYFFAQGQYLALATRAQLKQALWYNQDERDTALAL